MRRLSKLDGLALTPGARFRPVATPAELRSGRDVRPFVLPECGSPPAEAHCHAGHPDRSVGHPPQRAAKVGYRLPQSFRPVNGFRQSCAVIEAGDLADRWSPISNVASGSIERGLLTVRSSPRWPTSAQRAKLFAYRRTCSSLETPLTNPAFPSDGRLVAPYPSVTRSQEQPTAPNRGQRHARRNAIDSPARTRIGTARG